MKICFVTGGSKGIGKSIAETFLEKGYTVVSTYNNTLPENKNIDYIKCNALNSKDIKNAIDYVIKKYGKIDVLVNNLGISKQGLLQDYTDEDFNEMILVNTKSVFDFCKGFAPYMINQKQGSIINISSIWGIHGASNESLYSLTKGAVNSFSKALAKELGPSGIKVNTVCPGVIKTDMLNSYSKEELEELKNATPLLRLGEPKDVAELVYFLSQAEFITGEIITVDGGFTL